MGPAAGTAGRVGRCARSPEDRGPGLPGDLQARSKGPVGPYSTPEKTHAQIVRFTWASPVAGPRPEASGPTAPPREPAAAGRLLSSRPAGPRRTGPGQTRTGCR